MNSPEQNYIIDWRKTADNGAEILRIFTNLPTITIPSQIAGYPVTEIGSYCFAPSCQLPENYLTVSQPQNISSTFTVTELCGSYLEAVQLPDSLQKLKDYAFYNCRSLKKLEFSSQLRSIGSDVFMNCQQLQQLFLRCSPMEKTGLKQILTQISWNVEVTFMKKDPTVIFYPEYYEVYDEIAPAHIFGHKIIGEGFRARLCFQDGILDPVPYDQSFPKACAEESKQTLCRLAYYRLRYPLKLTEQSRQQYADYLLSHGEILCDWFIHEQRLDDLLFLFREKLLSIQQQTYALHLAAQAGWSEGSAGMLRWKQLHRQDLPRNRYEWKDF